MSDADRGRGFTLVELVIVVAIVGILASVALPLARWSVKRSREYELQEALRTIRLALDRYQDAARAGLIEVPEGASGYPPSLEVLVQGVPMIAEMPTPAPPVMGAYNATGAGLSGGLEAMAEAQREAQSGAGFAGGGPAGASAPPARPSLLESRTSMLRQAITQRPGPDSQAEGSRFNFSFRFGDQDEGDGPDGFGDDPAEPAEPLLGPDGQPLLLTFLRRLPVDPMTGEVNWGLRCYGEPPDDRLWCGTDVFDVYSRSPGRAIDGTHYRDW